MKRALDALQRDEQERQEDARLRAQLERDEIAQAANKKKKDKQDKFVEKWSSHLRKWNEMGMVSLAERTLIPPALTRPSMFSPSFPVFKHV